MKFTRGFKGRGSRARGLAASAWPVRHRLRVACAHRGSDAEHLDLGVAFSVEGLVRNHVTWTWDEIHALEPSTYEGDIHCVTTWSKFGVSFGGVSVDTLLSHAEPLPSASHVVAFSHTGYTTNLPLEDVTGGKAWVVWEYEGRPLEAGHGGPARLLVPHLYFWKSAKWVAGLRLLDHDEPGFWEVNGYHDRGDPWLEQRYQGD